MAKIVKGRTFKGVIKYILDKQKDTQLLDAEGLRLKSKGSVIQSFITQANLNTRVGKPVCHISLDFSAQDKDKMTNQLMVQITLDYMEQMGIKNTQYIIARHFDKEHPHLHLVYNRIGNDGKTITDSNDRIRSEKICKKLTEKYGLYFSSGKENVKEHRLREPDKTKYEIYHTLEVLVPKCKNWKQLISELKKADVEAEFKHNGNSDEVQGVKFRKNDYWFNGSKIDRLFSYSKIDYQLNQNKYKENIRQTQTHSNNNAFDSTIEAVSSVLGVLLDFQPNNPYNEDEAEFQKKLRKKKKPTRRYGRQQ